MAAIDTVLSGLKWPGSGKMVITDGASGTCTCSLIGSVTWDRPGRAYAEVMEKGRHQSPPVAVETTDGNISLTISGRVSSILGSSTVHPYEALQLVGGASGWTSTGNGSKKMIQIAIPLIDDDGVVQTATFRYCVPESFSFNPDGEDSQATFTATLTDLENDPQVV